MILDNDYETLTVKDDNGLILIRNIDEYNLMKYGDFDGKRIIKKLDKDTEITETFNDGIFNVRHKEFSLQVRDKIELCKRLKHCMAYNTIEPIKELLIKSVEKELDKNFLDTALKPFSKRIETKKDMIIIDKLFAVDQNGQAYIIEDDDKFKRLCIVAHETGKMNHVLSHTLGNFKLNFKTLEIYIKVLFLLFPNFNDKVFWNQLPKEIQGRFKIK